MRILQIDAFTAEPFRGNPAAVCILERERPDAWMQNVAAEMNLAETAFVRRLTDDAWSLRWFTPSVEVDLCGHATLATAHALWEESLLAKDVPALFDTRSGRLTATRQGQWIELDFPSTPAAEAEIPADLLPALGIDDAVFVGRSRFDYFVEISAAESVRRLRPDFRRLREIQTRGVIVTSVADDPQFDFISRFFAPASGIDEDPVTGSSHCALAPYWSEKLGRNELNAYQASSRGGVLRLRLESDRVKIGGQAVTTLRGELTV